LSRGSFLALPDGARNAGAIGSGSARSFRPEEPETSRPNVPRAAKCGSCIASSSVATMVAQQSAAANTGRHSSAVRAAISFAAAALVAFGSAMSFISGPDKPIAEQKASQNFCSSAAQATSL